MIYKRIQIVFERECSQICDGERTWKIMQPNAINPKRCIEYENAQILIDLYANLKDGEERESFISIIEEGISGRDEHYFFKSEIIYYGTSALAFYTLCRLGFAKNAVESSFQRFAQGNCHLLISLISDLCSDDFTYFGIDEIDMILNYCKFSEMLSSALAKPKNNLISVLSKAGVDLIRKEIRGVNLEVNRDKETVIAKLATLGMGDQYEITLNELDVYLATSSGVVASAMIGNFRSMWEQLIVDISKKISKILNEDIPHEQGKSAISDARIYIKKSLSLSDADNSFISRFVDILHAEGGHAFNSRVEYFRLTRNIGIEILLLLLSKTESLPKKT